MKREKVPPSGSIFLVPLRDHGYCVGVLTHASGKGHAFGYFFGPRISEPSKVNMNILDSDDAILIGKFGDLGFVQGNWPVIGIIQPWDQSQWPMLPLVRIDESKRRAWLSQYSDKFECVEEKEIDVSEAGNYPYDRMMGSGSIEIRLTKLMEEPNE